MAAAGKANKEERANTAVEAESAGGSASSASSTGGTRRGAGGLRIAFWSEQICERGTDVALFDYADFAERLLGYDVWVAYNLRSANNYAGALIGLHRFEEATSLLRKTVPVARRVLGENDQLTLKTRCMYATALYRDAGATLGDLREAVTTLEDAERIARRVLGGAHPIMVDMLDGLRNSRAALDAHETSA